MQSSFFLSVQDTCGYPVKGTMNPVHPNINPSAVQFTLLGGIFVLFVSSWCNRLCPSVVHEISLGHALLDGWGICYDVGVRGRAIVTYSRGWQSLVATRCLGRRIAARGPGDVVEAIEAGDAQRDWAVAVQWHPEMAPMNALHGRLFRAFVKRAAI